MPQGRATAARLPQHTQTPPGSQPQSPAAPTSNESTDNEESDDVVDPRERRRQLKKSLRERKRKRRPSGDGHDALTAYKKFAAWYTRNGQLTVDWQLALEKGISSDNQQYGKLTRPNFTKRYTKELSAYYQLKENVRSFEDDLKYIEKNPDALDNLADTMVTASGTAKSNDVSTLKGPVLEYTAQVHENQQLKPSILTTDQKSKARGFNHIQLARLLCPAKLLQKFDENPEEFRKELASGRQKVRSNDMPAFLWNRHDYDPEDILSNMFRSEVVVMTYRHIFTSPSSAAKEPGSSKTKGSHAKKNHMKSVTPESIVYACVHYCHGISSVEDWRMEDRIFDRAEFFKEMMEIFNEARASNPEWYYDLIQWWNVRVFGTELDCIDDSENEEGPSTLRLIRQQREAAKAMHPSYKLPPPDPNRSPEPAASPPPPHSPRLPTPKITQNPLAKKRTTVDDNRGLGSRDRDRDHTDNIHKERQPLGQQSPPSRPPPSRPPPPHSPPSHEERVRHQQQPLREQPQPKELSHLDQPERLQREGQHHSGWMVYHGEAERDEWYHREERGLAPRSDEQRKRISLSPFSSNEDDIYVGTSHRRINHSTPQDRDEHDIRENLIS